MIKILKYGQVKNEEIFSRCEGLSKVDAIVNDIINNVKERKDQALIEYEEKFDKVQLSSLQVTKEEIEEALSKVEPRFIEVLKLAAKNISEYHEKQLKKGFEIKKENGVVLGQKVTPVAKAGLYVPGGKAAYPSTVLMDSVPYAKAAIA